MSDQDQDKFSWGEGDVTVESADGRVKVPAQALPPDEVPPQPEDQTLSEAEEEDLEQKLEEVRRQLAKKKARLSDQD